MTQNLTEGTAEEKLIPRQAASFGQLEGAQSRRRTFTAVAIAGGLAIGAIALYGNWQGGEFQRRVMQVYEWLEQTSFSVWIRESGSIWAYPLVLTMHTCG